MSGPPSREPEAVAGHEFADAFASLSAAGHILAAVSGGPDSTALMQALAGWSAGRGGPKLSVATVDHGLRAGSRSEAEAVGAKARSIGLAHAILPWTAGEARRRSQEAARRARYDLLVGHAAELGATYLVTGHTLDDQAETLLIRLAAGSGVSGLAGMRTEVRRGSVLHARPFLRFAKARLVATCRARAWDFVVDPSNLDTAFARARWRRILPLLAEEGLDAERLARLADRVARADAALHLVASRAVGRLATIDRDKAVLPFELLVAEPSEIALRVLALALDRVPSPGPAIRLERLEACFAALCGAFGHGLAIRRTLAGRLLDLDVRGALTLRPEGVRRRGRPVPVTPMEIETGASLGRDPCGA
jgi:tRNA(Ile)-lysidine synthase